MRNFLLYITVGLIIAFGLTSTTSCQDRERDTSKKEKKEKRKRKNDNHIDVDMVKRITRFVKRNVEITPEQEEQIADIAREYQFDSLSREEFYFKRLDLRDRIFTEVLNEAQRKQIKKK